MKKEYLAPDFTIVSVLLQDSLSASHYVPDPEVPTRDGNDDEFDF